MPPAEPVMVVSPAFSAVTMPSALMVATSVLLDFHLRSLFGASFGEMITYSAKGSVPILFTSTVPSAL